ncbi:hypothetical protein B0H19DRAFT_1374021 [Mycena capillaripes]|nr:hypothetical protein B0H19DRAFT_1374021 [Mycena capillaripes]
MDAADNVPLLDPVTFAWDLRLYRSIVLAGLVLLIYDYTLTLSTEVKFIWAAKLRPSTCWFLALRYIGLAANITNCVINFAEFSHEVRVPLFSSFQALNDLFSGVCVKVQLVWKVLIVSQEILVECTLIMRVFAMYDRNWWTLICLLAVFAFWPAFVLWDVIKEGHPRIFSGPGINGCAASYTAQVLANRGGLGGTVTILASMMNKICPRSIPIHLSRIACDILVFLLTVRLAYVQRDMYPRYTGTLLWRMTTDGAVYFGIIIIANAVNLAMFYLCDTFLAGFLSWFITSLSMMLLARLMLNLHEAAAEGMTGEEPNTMELGTLRIRFLDELLALHASARIAPLVDVLRRRLEGSPAVGMGRPMEMAMEAGASRLPCGRAPRP